MHASIQTYFIKISTKRSPSLFSFSYFVKCALEQFPFRMEMLCNYKLQNKGYHKNAYNTVQYKIKRFLNTILRLSYSLFSHVINSDGNGVKV